MSFSSARGEHDPVSCRSTTRVLASTAFLGDLAPRASEPRTVERQSRVRDLRSLLFLRPEVIWGDGRAPCFPWTVGGGGQRARPAVRGVSAQEGPGIERDRGSNSFVEKKTVCG